MNNLYVLFGFDMETDCGSWSPYYEGLVKGTPLILELLKSKGINATFFFTGEAANLHPEIVEEIVRINSEHDIGCHSLYHETIGDPIFEIPGIKPLLPEEVKHRLEIATEFVQKASGIKPVSFRSPRLWGSTSVVLALEELGYLADASYPMYYFEKQLVPYHPSRENWLEKGDLKIVEIPNFADMTIESKDRYKRDRDQWPVFRNKDGYALLEHVRNFIEFIKVKNLPAFLCFYFHPWEFIEMPDRFSYGEGTVIPDRFLIENCGSYALKQLEIVIDGLLDKGAYFITAKKTALELNWV